MGVLKRSLQRIGTLTHLALLTFAAHEAPDTFFYDEDDNDGWTLQVSSYRALPVTQHLPSAVMLH